MFDLTQRQKLAALVLLVFLIIGGALLFINNTGNNAVVISCGVTDDCYVYLCGAVAKPGVVKVKTGTRVFQALPRAGGALPEADLNQINLAAFVEDGAQIYVPYKGETSPPTTQKNFISPAKSSRRASSASIPKPSGPFDLNTATQKQLESVPGIGPSLAASIIQYRQAHGKFHKYEELLQVKGIGGSKLEKFRAYLYVK